MTTDRITVLHLGWAFDAAEALARHECHTTFVVRAAEAEDAANHPDCHRVVVVRDSDRLEDVIAGLARAAIDVRSFDVVCTADEYPVVAAAVLAEAYRGHGWLSVDTAVAMRDKFVQKTRISDAGLPVARCWIVNSAEALREAAPVHCVVKPMDGAGTQLTYAVTDRESLDRAADSITASGQQGPWLVEEFVSGNELHLDGVVRDGQIRFLSVSRYLQNVINIQRGLMMGSVVADPCANRARYSRAEALASAALKALGHNDGVFHMEVFEDGEELVFSECAGRLSGGLLVQTITAKFGIDLFDEWARTVIGRPSGLPADHSVDDRSYGWVHLGAEPGTIVSIPSVDDLRGRPGVVEVQVSAKPGDIVPDSAAGSHLRVARVLMAGDTDDSTADDLRTFAQWFRSQVRVTP
jgi:biotin carboxylase